MTAPRCALPAMLLFLAGCAATTPAARPGPEPGPAGRDMAPPSGPATNVAPVATATRSLPPAEAFRAGMMPLASAGIPRFAAEHPTEDGRGVVIAILDSGIDPSVPGLQLTSEGLPKLLDLRDFSGEGRVVLQPLARRGDTLFVAGHRLLGAARVAAMADGGAFWGGVLDELPLGEPPAADLDGNGTVGDSLPLVVIRTGSGWAMFADTQGNGTLADDRPIRDYAVARETFGWSLSNAAPPVTLAVNLADSAGAPVLNLFFDTSSHGTHVAGIAAGHDLYDVPGFDGVAPGARLIGLKIANDAHGGVTVTGAMIRALDYAIRFARDRNLRLVANLSFGVGNTPQRTARIDVLIDSVLAANPDVVMTVAAGNDGPGLGTVGFPGSAARVLSVGASEPGVFDGLTVADGAVEGVAPFSSRGGTRAAPDIIAPGTAYSTIPNFAIGGEQESGTSMATPYAAGLVARLLSGFDAHTRPPPASAIVQALRAAGRSPAVGGPLDAGWGLPDLTAAWTWIRRSPQPPPLVIAVGGQESRGAVFVAAAAGERARSVHASVQRREGEGRLELELRPTEAWIHAPLTLVLARGGAEFEVAVALAALAPGAHTGAIELRIAGSDSQPIARIPVTAIIPLSATDRVATQSVVVPSGGVGRVFIPAERGRGMQIEIATAVSLPQVTASLHEPGGMPFRDGAQLPAGSGDGAALFDIGAGDVMSGLYEVDVASGPLAGSSAIVTVRRAPLLLDATLAGDTVRVVAQSIIGTPLAVRLRAGLVGAERTIAVRKSGDAPVRVAIAVPAWAARVQVDSRMPDEQWDAFTDLGMSFTDRHGRQFATSPVNYPFARAAPRLPPELIGDTLVVVLSPAFAKRLERVWQLDLLVRFYGERVVGLDNGGRPAVTLGAGASLEQRFHTGPMPIDLSGGLVPVLIVLAQEGEDSIWMRELAPQGGRTP
ncbi:MAG: S8 family serine peptidase [Gemmatimonadota bacterium]